MSTIATYPTAKTSFDNVADHVMRDSEGKSDYIVPLNNMHIDHRGNYAFKNLNKVQGPRLRDIPFQTTDWAESQMLTKLGMPTQYFRKAKEENPELFTQHINYWLAKSDNQIMLRTKVNGADFGMIRGVVSPSFSTLDNDFVINVLQQIFGKNQADFEVCMYHLDSARFHLRIAYLDATKPLGTMPDGMPDYSRIGADIINSEVGRAAFNYQSMLWRLICANGMRGWDNDGDAFVQRHIHLKPTEFQHRVIGAVTDSFNSGHEFMQAFEEKQNQTIINPFSVIKRIAKQNKYSRDFADTIQENFEGEGTAYGVINAITRSARELPNARRLEVETDAGQLVRLPARKWEAFDTIVDAEWEEVS